MRRKAVHLIAAIAESVRFLAVLFLAFDLGALFDSSVSSLVRYAAAPQLLFAAGFFFLWLDPPRYSPYRPLLIIGKLASVVCLVGLAADLLRDPTAIPAALGLAFIVGAVDILSLSVLILAKPEGAALQRPPAADQGPSAPGQGPDEIEQVEAL
jgi:hypothetical protein